VLDFETKSAYGISVDVDDPAVGATPDASAPYTLTLTDVVNETAAPGTVAITEVAPWSSGNSPIQADWFEVTNLGGTTVDISGWRMDDNSYAFGSSVALRGVTQILGGHSVIFIESGPSPDPVVDPALIKKFCQNWYGADTPPASVQIGTYGGSGVGLSTGGDAVNLFDGLGARVTGVSFGSSTAASPFKSFDNTLGIGGILTPAPAITSLSAVGVNGAYSVTHTFVLNSVTLTPTEYGSPGKDFLPPTFTNVPLDMAVEATGPSTPVSFTAPTATDLIDGARTVGCTPASGSTFPLGTTTVNCVASDVSGNTASVSFKVTVEDTNPPVVNVPSDITAEATGTLTLVPFGPVTAQDAVDGALTATASPASPGPFPLGTTHIDCFVTDAHGNLGSAPFNITVHDTTAPVVTVPANIIVDATSPGGAVVSYTAGASDLVGVATFICLPASGSTFPIGTTTVHCTATDTTGNSGAASFTVHVTSAAEQLASLLANVNGIGPGNSLTAKIADAVKKFAKGDASGASSALSSFISEVNAQSGKKISAAQATALIAQALQIKSVLGV
jgi:hypothetical protein